MKKYNLLVTFLLLNISVLNAQELITGKVVDIDGNGIPGVSIVVEGTIIGTVTDIDGNFQLLGPENAVLLISFVGMKTIQYIVDQSDIIIEFPDEYKEESKEKKKERPVYMKKERPDYVEEEITPIPQFELPPPKASSRYVFEKSRFKKYKKLKDIDEVISGALSANGYSEKSYFSVPNGFALVTRIEKINEDGTSVEPPDRWNVDELNFKFSISNYLKALFLGTKGYYRVIVFVVTDKSFSTSNKEISKKEAYAWLNQGNLTLPEYIGNMKFTRRHQIVSLVYEFSKKESAEPIFSDPSKLTGENHLIKANILPWILVQTPQ
ncbi:MAG: carboxypeptidase-like regulatory domain-containing protein [Bacteroidota bacterium]